MVLLCGIYALLNSDMNLLMTTLLLAMRFFGVNLHFIIHHHSRIVQFSFLMHDAFPQVDSEVFSAMSCSARLRKIDGI